jgi:hypothetical protein
MQNLPQRWLSLSGICTTLNLQPRQIKSLYNHKLLVRIGKTAEEFRYLDPTPEYAERLRLAAVMLSKNPVVNIDLPMTFLLTIREIAEIMGWDQRKTTRILEENKVPCWKSANRARLFSVTVVRDLIWRRNGRKLSKQKAPMLLSDIIAFAKRFIDSETALMPTDEAFKADEELQRKLAWVMRQKSPEREAMLADLCDKLELAKQVAVSLSARP